MDESGDMLQLNKQLVDAVHGDNIEKAKHLLEKGVSANARDVAVLIENVWMIN